MKIPLSRPEISEKDIEAVVSVLRTPNLSLGPKLLEFEKKLKEYVGSRYAVAVNSGTSGLHLSLIASGIRPEDEVITTPFSFIASANAILYVGAKPVFVDIDERTLNINPEKIEERVSKKTKALLVVHVFGTPCDMQKIEKLTRKYNLKLIEDACEALGAEYKGKKVGTFGDAGVFAFYPNKQITTGEGGVIVTNSKPFYEHIRSLRNQGRSNGSGWLTHHILGYNYRISDINAALGVSQMERIDQILKKREGVATYYIECLKEMDEIELPHCPDDCKVSWFVFVVRLKDGFKRKDRDRVIEYLRKNGVECGNYFPPIHLQPLYQRIFGYRRGEFPITESISERTIALPFYNYLKKEQIEYVADKLRKAIKGLKSGKK